MFKKYKADEYWKLYEDLPQKVKEVFWEEDMGKRLEKISERFSLEEKEKETLLELVVHLFLGVFPPSHIAQIIEKEIPLSGDGCEKLTTEFIRFIVYPSQNILRELYSEEEFNKIGVKKGFQEEKTEEKGPFEDSYREPIN